MAQLRYDECRIIEHILASGNAKRIGTLGELLDRFGFTVSAILDGIQSDRDAKGLLSWD
jgi:hypothetical protein